MRKILMSVLIVAAMAALVGGATFATFTDSGTATGAVTAGTVVVELNDLGDPVTLSLTGLECATNMAYLESCTASLKVENAGTLSVTYQVTVTDGNATCFTSTLSNEDVLEQGDATDTDAVGGVGTDWDKLTSSTGTLTITLDSDAATCQSASSTTTVTVIASQSATPHD